MLNDRDKPDLPPLPDLALGPRVDGAEKLAEAQANVVAARLPFVLDAETYARFKAKGLTRADLHAALARLAEAGRAELRASPRGVAVNRSATAPQKNDDWPSDRAP